VANDSRLTSLAGFRRNAHQGVAEERGKESELEPLLTSAEAATIPPAPDSRLELPGDAQLVAAPMVASGVVDAILEVSRQRMSLLNRLRSVLQSGNNTEALKLARQLCGIQG
jgi:hypothetical protein